MAEPLLERAAQDYAAAFAPGLIAPTLPAPADVVAANGKQVAKRYNVYRNNVTVSLIDALASIYPAVQRITGVEFFRAMARFHVRATPPFSPLLFEYGREFPAFIEWYEYAQHMPWLADTARIERAWLDAYHAADARPLEATALASIDPEQLAQVRFVPHPATRIVRSPYPAVSIFAMNRIEAPTGTVQSAEAEDALITRPDNEVVVSRLPAGGATFLQTLIQGQPFHAAVEAAFEETPSFDLATILTATISAGVFTAINLGE